MSSDILTATKLRTHVTTSLTDAALQDIIDGEDAAIIDRCGSLAAQVEEFESEYQGVLIHPKRAVSSITSIVEKWPDTFLGGYSETTLSATDYELVPGGKQIRRLMTGPHPLSSWGTRVVLTYTPVSDTARRVLALINLCKLNLAFNGLDSESVGGGEYRMDSGDYSKKREEILAGLIGSNQRSFA